MRNGIEVMRTGREGRGVVFILALPSEEGDRALVLCCPMVFPQFVS
jgi:hypothetical protein